MQRRGRHRGKGPRQSHCEWRVPCEINSYYRKRVPWLSTLRNTRLNRLLVCRTSQSLEMPLRIVSLQDVSAQGMGHFPNVSDQGALSGSILWDNRLFGGVGGNNYNIKDY